jgi:hypothetical protein
MMGCHQAEKIKLIKEILINRTTEEQNRKNDQCLEFLDAFLDIEEDLGSRMDLSFKSIIIHKTNESLVINFNAQGVINIEKRSNYDVYKSMYLEQRIIKSEILKDILIEYKKEAKINKMSSIYK